MQLKCRAVESSYQGDSFDLPFFLVLGLGYYGPLLNWRSIIQCLILWNADNLMSLHRAGSGWNLRSFIIPETEDCH